MASISLDRKTKWWSVRYLADPIRGKRIKKTLCKHDGMLPRAGKRGTSVPLYVQRLAAPFLELERRIKLGMAPPVDSRTGLESHLSAYLNAFKQTHPIKTSRYVERIVYTFLDFCKSVKVAHLQAVTPPVCRSYLALRGESIARSTLKTERGFLMPIFSQARRDRLIADNPWEFVRVEGKDRAEAPTYWTEAELDRLLAVATGWHRDMIVLAVNTGIRISALLSLRWTDVDWPRGVVHVRASQSKSGRYYEVPMTGVARDVLTRRRAVQKSDNNGLVIGNPATGRPYASQSTYEAIKKYVRKAGIPDHGDYNHVLRRTFATLAIDAGVPLATVSRWLGHASVRTTQAYLGHRVEDSRRHMEGFGLGTATATGQPAVGDVGKAGDDSAAAEEPDPPHPSG